MNKSNSDAGFQFHEEWLNPETGRKKKHVYLMDGKQMTGVTTVLGVLAKPALIQWAADMTADWIRENCKLWTGVTETEKRSYDVTEEDLQEAVKAHAKKKEEAGTKGTDVHALVEAYIKSCIDGKPLEQKSDEKMVQAFIDWAVKNQVRFLASEKQVYSKEWFCAGTADFTCEIGGKRYVGDLKTMKKMWDRVPFFQTAAYMKMLVEMGESQYDGSVIVNINKESAELTEYYTYDWKEDQTAFEAALTLYRQLANF